MLRSSGTLPLVGTSRVSASSSALAGRAMTAPDGRDSRVAPPRRRGGLPRGRPDVPRRALVVLFRLFDAPEQETP